MTFRSNHNNRLYTDQPYLKHDESHPNGTSSDCEVWMQIRESVHIFIILKTFLFRGAKRWFIIYLYRFASLCIALYRLRRDRATLNLSSVLSPNCTVKCLAEHVFRFTSSVAIHTRPGPSCTTFRATAGRSETATACSSAHKSSQFRQSLFSIIVLI